MILLRFTLLTIAETLCISAWENEHMNTFSDVSKDEYDEQVPVLIVGGSLVGLSTSLFLSWHGIASILVERHAGLSPHSRAGGLNARTMEIFDRVGVAEAIHRIVPPSAKFGGILRLESLVGKEFGWLTQNVNGERETEEKRQLGPISNSFIVQNMLEPILQARARELGSDLRFNTALTAFEQDEDGVRAVIRDQVSGEERRIHARYLIAADGNRSSIREQLGISVHGPGTLGNQMSILFKADLRAAVRDRHIFLGYIMNEQIQGGVIGVAPDQQYGMLVLPYHPENGEDEQSFMQDRGLAAVRAAVGIPDLSAEIMGTQSWRMAALVADCLQQERVFLVGDAAHVMPPTGGFGANTGIGDAYNLAWKLAFVLNGKAETGLLASYDPERRPVAEFTVEQAYARYLRRLTVGSATGEHAEIPYESVIFGYRYQSPIVLSGVDDEREGLVEDPYQPSGHPGIRAPHIVLKHGDEHISILDLFGKNYVLLIASAGEMWRDAIQLVRTNLRFELDVYQIGKTDNDLIDEHDSFLAAYGLTESGAVLVRPDGYIAWRALDVRAAIHLEQVMMLLLARA